MYGGGAGTMTLDELQSLEKYLEIWMYHIRSAKVIISSKQYIICYQNCLVYFYSCEMRVV